MTSTHGELKVGTAVLSYEVTPSDPPGAPVIVLLHGFALDRRMWNDQMPVLSPAYTVVRYDLRGFGKSTPGSDPYTHAADLAALLDHLQIRQATIVGLSLGGGAAINFAIVYPKRVQALVLVDATLGGFAWGPDFNTTQKAVREAAKRNIQLAKDVWLGLPLFESAMSNPPVAAWMRKLVGDYSGWHWHNPDRGKAMTPPAVQRLDRIKAPTLVIVGERDIPDFHRIAETLAKGIGGSKKLVLPSAGHMSNMESVVTFNHQLQQFLQGVTRPRTSPHLQA